MKSITKSLQIIKRKRNEEELEIRTKSIIKLLVAVLQCKETTRLKQDENHVKRESLNCGELEERGIVKQRR